MARPSGIKAVFADTLFFVAYFNRGDQWHPAAVRAFAESEATYVTTAWVLTEIADACAGYRRRRIFGQVISFLKQAADTEVIGPSAQLWDRGCALYLERADRDWSLTDCISLSS